MIQRIVFTLLLGVSISSPVYSANIDVETMSINGGYVTHIDPNVTTSYELLTGDIGSIVMGQYQGFPACCSPDAALTSLAYYQFGFFGWVGIYTSQFDQLSNQALVPSAFIDTANSSIHVDLSSWTWSFNGSTYHRGASDIVGTYDLATGAYDISWSSTFDGGYFSTQDWNLTGVATLSAVPIPSAVWLFSSGLIGLIGVARRKV